MTIEMLGRKSIDREIRLTVDDPTDPDFYYELKVKGNGEKRGGYVIYSGMHRIRTIFGSYDRYYGTTGSESVGDGQEKEFLRTGVIMRGS